MTQRYYARDDAFWIFPDQQDPPKGTTILLLTVRGICVKGKWEDEGYLAWHPLPKIPENRKHLVQ